MVRDDAWRDSVSAVDGRELANQILVELVSMHSGSVLWGEVWATSVSNHRYGLPKHLTKS